MPELPDDQLTRIKLLESHLIYYSTNPQEGGGPMSPYKAKAMRKRIRATIAGIRNGKS